MPYNLPNSKGFLRANCERNLPWTFGILKRMIGLKTSAATSNWMRFAWRTSQIAIFVFLAWRQFKLENSARNQFDQRIKQEKTLSAPTYNINNSSYSNSNKQSHDVSNNGIVDSENNPIFTKPLIGSDMTINKKYRTYDRSICQLFDFAITGFAKCGTTSVHAWIDAHNDTRVAEVSLGGKERMLLKQSKELSSCPHFVATVVEPKMRHISLAIFSLF